MREILRARWFRWMIAVIALFRVALPEIAERLVERQTASLTGLDTQIDDVDFSLLRGGVRIEGLRIGDDVVSANQLAANFEWSHLLAREARFREIEFDAPSLEVRREADGSLTFPIVPNDTAEEANPEEGGAPWPLALDSVVIRDASFRVQDDERASIGELHLDSLELNELRIDHGGTSIGPIHLEAPVVALDAAAWKRTPSPTQAAGTAAEPPAVVSEDKTSQVEISALSIRNAMIHLGRETERVTLRYEVSAEGISLDPEQRWPLHLVLSTDEGRLEAQGKVRSLPPAWNGTLEWSGVDVPRLLAASEVVLPWQIRSALTQGSLRGGVETGGAGSVSVSGSLAVANFHAEESASGNAARFERLEIDAERVIVPLGQSGEPVVAELTRIALSTPDFNLRRAAPADDVAADETPTDAAQEAPPSTAPSIAIGAFQSQDGRLRVLDESVTPRQELGLQAIQADLANLQWPEQSVERLRVEGRVDTGGEILVEGSTQNGSGTTTLNITALDLRALGGYASQAGYDLDQGALDLATTAVLAPETIQAKNRITLRDLAVQSDGNQFEEIVGVPLDVALALLRDPAGKIGLSVPVEVSSGETRISVAATLRSALRSALVGALSAPLKTAGLLVPDGFAGGGTDATADTLALMLRFDPGSADLAPDAQQRIANLAALLQERPGVSLEIRGSANASELERAVAAPPNPERNTLLRRATKMLRFGDRDDPPDDDDRRDAPGAAAPWRALADARAGAVLAVIVSEHGIPSTQLSVAEPFEGEAGAELKPRFRATP